MMRHLTRRHSIFASQAASALASSCELPLHSVLPSILSRLPAAQGAPAPGTLRGLGTAAFPAPVQTGPEAPKASRDVRSGPLPSGSGGGGRNMGPVLLLPAAIAAGLGAWQLARRREKQTMLDHRLAAMQVHFSCRLTVLLSFTPPLQDRTHISILDHTSLQGLGCLGILTVLGPSGTSRFNKLPGAPGEKRQLFVCRRNRWMLMWPVGLRQSSRPPMPREF